MEQKKNTDTRKTVRTVTSNDFITAMGIEEMTLKATKNCNGKQPQTYMFSSLAAISDMSFVIFARANVF